MSSSWPSYPFFLEIEGRRERLVRAAIDIVPYVMLAFSVLLTMVITRATRQSPVPALVMSAVAAAWMLWMCTLHPAWRERPRAMAVFVTVLLGLMTLMVIAYPWFGFFSFTGYFYVFRLASRRWWMAGTALVAILDGTSQAGGLPTADPVRLTLYSGAVLVNLVFACVFGWFGWFSYMQTERRKRLVEELTEANGRLEATLAENAGLHEQLLVQAREAGVLDERQRMAREIHDTLAQGLTGIITQLQAAEQAGQHAGERRRHFDAAVRLARDSLAEARRSVHALRSEQLETARLSDALAAVAERWSSLNGVPAQVTITGTVRPAAPEAEFTLLRTAQEALANVAKHAEATRVGLTLSYVEGEVILDVRDDGKGFDVAKDDRREGAGFGLVAMRQRIEALSGTLQIESEPGLGTAISACVPAVRTGVLA